MQIMMTPGLCSNEHRTTGGTFCESCFSAFLMHGCYPDRPCITNVVDDGKEEITLVLQHGDQQTVMVINDENREFDRLWRLAGLGSIHQRASRVARFRAVR